MTTNTIIRQPGYDLGVSSMDIKKRISKTNLTEMVAQFLESKDSKKTINACYGFYVIATAYMFAHLIKAF